jgi:hypothetical protein
MYQENFAPGFSRPRSASEINSEVRLAEMKFKLAPIHLLNGHKMSPDSQRGNTHLMSRILTGLRTLLF